MKCKYNDNIVYTEWEVLNIATQVEFHKRKELKEEICDELCDKTEQRICKLLTSIKHDQNISKWYRINKDL